MTLPSEQPAKEVLPTVETTTGHSMLDALTGNPLFAAGFGLLGATVGLSVLRRMVIQGGTLLQRRLLVTLEIPSNDRAYPWFLHWMSGQAHHGPPTHQLAVETSLERQSTGAIRARFSLVPGQGKHYVRYRDAWIRIERQRDKRFKDANTGSPWETVALTTLSRDRRVFESMLREAEEAAMAKQEGRTTIFTSYGPNWQAFGAPRKRRGVESVILDEGIAEGILRDIREFIASGAWYTARGIPYRRGYLLHGPPGTGKTSFIQALAGELEWNICLLNLAERGLTDDRLNHLLMNAPERAIILLEDVDAAFAKRDPNAREGFQSMVTFSGLLNALDGVASAEERVIFMTTNHIERLDPALIRPGRADVRVLIGRATEHQIRRMFLRFYEGEETMAEAFVKAVRGREVSTAALQGHFVFWRQNAKAAVDHVEGMFDERNGMESLG